MSVTISETTPSGLTQKQFAAFIGVAENTVVKAVREGRLELGDDGLLDVADSMARWKQRARRGRPTQTASGRPDLRPMEERDREAAGVESTQPGARLEGIDSIEASERRLAHFKAEKAELDAARARGELLPAGDVEAAAFACYRQMRDLLLIVRDRIAPLLVGQTDLETIREMLDREHRDALLALGVDGAEADSAECAAGKRETSDASAPDRVSKQ